MKNNLKNILKTLKPCMFRGQLASTADIIPDNQRHDYITNINGQKRKATYIATHKPLGNTGPLLMCSYGLVDEQEQYTYSSFQEKN